MAASLTLKQFGLSFEIVTVTPAQAKLWLGENHEDNRGLNKHRVNMYARDMVDGKWMVTHQSICFDQNGKLIDGQHRLNAVIVAGKAVVMLKAVHDTATVTDPIDVNLTRSISFLTGLHNRTVGALSILRKFETGQLTDNTPMSAELAGDIYAHHKRWFDLIQADNEIKKTNLVSGLQAACIWAMPINPDKALQFLQQVTTGEMIVRKDPAWAFRNWREHSGRPLPIEMAMAAANCVRHHINGKPLTSVHTGIMGYRAATSKRRALRIPNTPDAKIVESVSWGQENDQ